MYANLLVRVTRPDGSRAEHLAHRTHVRVGVDGLLGSLLGGAQPQVQQSSGNAMIDMASNMLDSDRDGSSLDDIASMAFNYLTKK